MQVLGMLNWAPRKIPDPMVHFPPYNCRCTSCGKSGEMHVQSRQKLGGKPLPRVYKGTTPLVGWILFSWRQLVLTFHAWVHALARFILRGAYILYVLENINVAPDLRAILACLSFWSLELFCSDWNQVAQHGDEL